MLDFNVRSNWEPPQWPIWVLLFVLMVAAVLSIF